MPEPRKRTPRKQAAPKLEPKVVIDNRLSGPHPKMGETLESNGLPYYDEKTPIYNEVVGDFLWPKIVVDQ